ncbi:MAG: cytochrome c oxidase subunit 3 [Cyanobacteriota bacterium]|nr:cytochrome c oxidase subunit 3 [Cyanobacteriota bacterium]
MTTLPVLPPSDSGAAGSEAAAAPVHGGHTLTGFVLFLCSESLIFLALFAGYATYRLSSPEWLPAGVTGLEWAGPLRYSIVLVSSSLVILLAERALARGRRLAFRLWWLLTMLMGAVFLYGQASEWLELPFGLRSGVFGASFFLLTGFHGLHVLIGLVLMAVMLVRSFGAAEAPGEASGEASGEAADPGSASASSIRTGLGSDGGTEGGSEGGSEGGAEALPGDGDHTGITAVALFWHFVDVIWVALFLLLYVWR